MEISFFMITEVHSCIWIFPLLELIKWEKLLLLPVPRRKMSNDLACTNTNERRSSEKVCLIRSIHLPLLSRTFPHSGLRMEVYLSALKHIYFKDKKAWDWQTWDHKDMIIVTFAFTIACTDNCKMIMQARSRRSVPRRGS